MAVAGIGLIPLAAAGAGVLGVLLYVVTSAFAPLTLVLPHAGALAVGGALAYRLADSDGRAGGHDPRWSLLLAWAILVTTVLGTMGVVLWKLH